MLALDRAQRGSVQFFTFMSQYICCATSAGRKAGRLSTNTAQSVDRLSTNKAYQYLFQICIYGFHKCGMTPAIGNVLGDHKLFCEKTSSKKKCVFDMKPHIHFHIYCLHIKDMYNYCDN